MRRKAIYLTIFAIIALVFVIRYISSLQSEGIVDNKVSITSDADWNMIISESVNQEQVKIEIDSASVKTNSEDIYMDVNKNIMISEDVLTSLFSCATNRYYSNILVIEKSDIRIIITTGSKMISVNGEQESIDTAATIRDGVIYVPITLICNQFSYKYTWEYNSNTIKLTDKKSDEKVYPYYYDYRNDGKLPEIKNQADLGTCWAFAALTALETTLLPEKSYDFSEDHLTMNNGYNIDPNEGGDAIMAMAYLTTWEGPVLESQDPYGDGYSPDNLEPIFHIQEIQIIESKNLDAIKKTIFLYGGVQSSLYLNIRDANGYSSEFYDSEQASYCYFGTEKSNHDIVIIGWDDSYPASNFVTQPEEDGAFICVNSWGEQFGDNGYFFVSYYDVNIGMHNTVYTGIEDTDNYDNIYQSDILGWVGLLGYNREYAYFANVYEAEQEEELEAVSFYATGVDTSYKVYVVSDFENTDSLKDRSLIASGSFTNAGYYTVEISQKIELEAGNKYAIIVYIDTPNSIHPIAIEYQSEELSDTVDISDGEGYISLHGTLWEQVETTHNCNLCLKMFTNDIEN